MSLQILKSDESTHLHCPILQKIQYINTCQVQNIFEKSAVEIIIIQLDEILTEKYLSDIKE